MVQALNLILLTATEVRASTLQYRLCDALRFLFHAQTADLRAALKNSVENRQGAALFTALYPSWCHSAVATVSLCLLSQVRSATAAHPGVERMWLTC